AEVVHYHIGAALLYELDEGSVVYLVPPEEDAGKLRCLWFGTPLGFSDKFLYEFDMLRRRDAHAGHQHLGYLDTGDEGRVRLSQFVKLSEDCPALIVKPNGFFEFNGIQFLSGPLFK